MRKVNGYWIDDRPPVPREQAITNFWTTLAPEIARLALLDHTAANNDADNHATNGATNEGDSLTR